MYWDDEDEEYYSDVLWGDREDFEWNTIYDFEQDNDPWWDTLPGVTLNNQPVRCQDWD